MAAHGFAIGGLHGWRGILLGLAASLALLEAGRQDVSPGIGMTSSAFWFLPALVFAGGITWLGVAGGIWPGALLGLGVFCLEVWLIQRWWRVAVKKDHEEGSVRNDRTRTS